MTSDFSQVREGDEFVVRLTKIGDSFGLNVAVSERNTLELAQRNDVMNVVLQGGVNTTVKEGGVYVKSLTDGGAAQRESHVRVGECSSCSTGCVGIYVQSCDVITRAWQAIVCSPSTTFHCAASRTSKQSRLCAVLP